MFSIFLPQQFAVSENVAGNPIRQLLRDSSIEPLDCQLHTIKKTEFVLAHRPESTKILIVHRRVTEREFPEGDILRLRVRSLDRTLLSAVDDRRWSSTIIPQSYKAHTGLERVEKTRASWHGQFSYKAENAEFGEFGLRCPQLGAIHSTLAHWSITPEEPATVAMPTGTGKTEVMLALLVQQRLERLLVVVPSRHLRDQIAAKFLSWGMLRSLGVVGPEAMFPVVGKIRRRFPNPDGAKDFMESCNVIVTTMQALHRLTEEVRRVLHRLCSTLFIDEAHHVSAPSWNNFRAYFYNKPVVQFTATPFRNDRRRVGGRLIYNYPLRKAQQEGYFRKIQFRPVFAFVDSDLRIASAAVAQLRADLTENLDHLLLARANTIERSEAIFKIYQDLAPDLRPLFINHEMSSSKQKSALDSLRQRDSRIIVCVDMLGEGFDLPQLKIAALHDMHKTLPITLQFVGRFTRSLQSSAAAVGEATVIANRARLDVQQRLRSLYAEDADWNELVRELGTEAIDSEERRSSFERSFTDCPAEVAIQSVQPKMSTVVYRTQCKDWDPSGIDLVWAPDARYTKKVAITHQHRVAWFVTRETAQLRWGRVGDIENISYELYLVHWDQLQNLLFINSSNNDTLHETLAKAICGEDVELIKGINVYRALNNIRRMVATNLGLLDLVSRTRRFMMLVGADTTEGLDPAQSANKTKTNIFGHGYENEEKVTIGCSLKGRIWSWQVVDDLSRWVDWCQAVGEKLVDDKINIEAVFGNFVKPEYATVRPKLVPLSIEWPLAFISEQEHKISVAINHQEVLLFDAGIEIVDYTSEQAITFRVFANSESADYTVVFSPEGTYYVPLADEARIQVGRRTRPLSEWFRKYTPKIFFEQDTVMEHDYILRMSREVVPFDLEKIEHWDWSGVDIQVESQGPERLANSIQRRVIERVLSADPNWDVVFDDDDAREISDVVAIRMDGARLRIHLYHCKFSRESHPGSRVEDFYAVCGQAQKSIIWRERAGLAQFVPHLVNREQSRLSRNGSTRFEKGDLDGLAEIAQRLHVLRPEFKIFIVQPGLAKSKITSSVSELLAATSIYLRETYDIPLGVIASS